VISQPVLLRCSSSSHNAPQTGSAVWHLPSYLHLRVSCPTFTTLHGHTLPSNPQPNSKTGLIFCLPTAMTSALQASTSGLQRKRSCSLDALCHRKQLPSKKLLSQRLLALVLRLFLATLLMVPHMPTLTHISITLKSHSFLPPPKKSPFLHHSCHITDCFNLLHNTNRVIANIT
jgi:hypothetical protein